jgi:hypothetical protein
MKPTARTSVQLSESLHHRLNAYALVASAAGVGLLALANHAEAKIVYTPAHCNAPLQDWTRLLPDRSIASFESTSLNARWRYPPSILGNGNVLYHSLS